MKKAIAGSERPLGESRIDGRRVEGFLVTQDRQETEIWVDAETAHPVRLEMAIPEMGVTVVMTDFVLNRELDDSLFALIVPEGYALRTVEFRLGNATEADLLAGLRILAELNGGTFPAKMFPAWPFARSLAAHAKAQGLSLKERIALANRFARMLVFLRYRVPPTEWTYVGGGVPLGQAGRAVFWYRPPGQRQYRLIYGDLHVEQVARRALPPVQPAVPTGRRPATSAVPVCRPLLPMAAVVYWAGLSCQHRLLVAYRWIALAAMSLR